MPVQIERNLASRAGAQLSGLCVLAGEGIKHKYNNSFTYFTQQSQVQGQQGRHWLLAAG